MAEILSLDPTKLMLCSCGASMSPDAEAIRKATGLACGKIHSELCGAEAGAVAEALAAGGPVLVACGQEADRFAELAEDAGAADRLTAVDLRDRAGWTEEAAAAGPKMAALVAEARLPAPAVPVFDVVSSGQCLVYGPEEVVLAAAERLAAALTVTAMLTEPAEILAVPHGVAVVSGRISRLEGALGRFELTVDRFAELSAAGRGARQFTPPVDGAQSGCDIVVDFSGGRALVPAAHKRDGYLRADPNDPLAVERALFDAAQLLGEFEKPLHIRVTESLCAHSRARQTGCTRCLNVCPTGAITPAGEHIAIDSNVCAGCGACSAVCPSGAVATEEPPVAHLFRRMRTLAEIYRAAGGAAPRLLVHDAHGAEMIRLGARHGRGLPADVIPFEIPALAGFGHAEVMAALALGFSAVDILPAPQTEREVISEQLALAGAILAATPAGAGRARLLEAEEPDALMEALYGAAPEPHGAEPILAAGGRRETLRLAARALAGDVPEDPIPLPAGAPYGTVKVNTDACTLCLSCASLCPTGALSDSPDRPELSFREEACVQCGLCAGLCPESAITLVPQLDLSDAVLRPQVLNDEEPFACTECGKLFGVKSSIERIVEKLSTHAMFQNSDNAKLIQMCDDCRVRAQYHSDSAPFSFGDRPKVRTTDDYLSDREKDG